MRTSPPPFPLQDLGRAREILNVLVRHGFGSALGKLPRQLLGRSDGDAGGERGDGRLTGPERALAVIEELGPTFVKLGQVLSTRPDVLPTDYLDAFARLQDAVPPFPAEQSQAIVAEELRHPISDLFAEFDPEPVASASIAQVHRAVMPDGREVAVKVQRPDIEDRIRSDIHILYHLAEASADSLEDLGLYSATSILQQFERAITSELDFLAEARNAETLRRNLVGIEGVRMPEVLRRFSTHRVLTLEWMDGAKLSADDTAITDPRLVMERITAATFQQVFVDGFFHADPHPGNLLIQHDQTVCYVDFGLVGQLTRSQQDLLIDAFVAIIFRDAESVARTCYRVGASEERLDLRAFAGEVDELFGRYADLSMAEQPMGTILTDLVRLTAQHRLRLPAEYAMLARAGMTLDGLARMHVPDWNMFETLRPFAMRLAARRHDLGRLSTDALSLANQAVSAARDLPIQLDQILLDLEKGRLQVATRSPEIEQLTAAVRRIGTSLMLVIGAVGTLISAAVLTAGTDANLFGFPFMKAVSAFAIVVSLGTASGLIGALGFHLAMSGRLRPRVLGRFLTWLLRRDK